MNDKINKLQKIHNPLTWIPGLMKLSLRSSQTPNAFFGIPIWYQRKVIKILIYFTSDDSSFHYKITSDKLILVNTIFWALGRIRTIHYSVASWKKCWCWEISVLATSMIVAVTTFWYTWSMGSEENVGKGRYYPHSCRDFFFLFKAGKIRERKKSGDFNAIFTNRRKTILRLTTQWFKVTKNVPSVIFPKQFPLIFITSDKSIIYITSEKQGFGKDP